jgi:hypothetical protein
MKMAFVFAGILLLGGCASEAPKFAGRPATRGSKADAAWNRQLSAEPNGTRNFATVRAVRGGAGISGNGGGSWKAARVGAHVEEGDLVRTGPGASTDLFLGENGPVLRVAPESRLRVVRLNLKLTGIEKVIDTMLDLEEGKVLGSVKKMAAASSYMIRTPAGLVRVRGTEFASRADGVVSVVSGTVVVIMGEKEIVLSASQQCDPKGTVKRMKFTEFEEVQSIAPKMFTPL